MRMSDSSETVLVLSVESSNESNPVIDAPTREKEVANFSGFLTSINRGGSFHTDTSLTVGNDGAVNDQMEVIMAGELYDANGVDSEWTRWSTEGMETSNEPHKRQKLPQREDSNSSFSMTHAGQVRKSPPSKLSKPLKTNSGGDHGFASALAKLPVVCSSPSSVAHLSVSDMKILLRPSLELNTKMSKEDLRYELFLLIKSGKFEKDISQLKGSQSQSGASSSGGAYRHHHPTSGRQQRDAIVRYFVSSTTSAKLWENVDNSLFETRVDESGTDNWERVSEMQEEALESGNPEYFSRRMLKSFLAHRQNTMLKQSRASERCKSGGEVSGGELLLQQLQNAIIRFRAKQEGNASVSVSVSASASASASASSSSIPSAIESTMQYHQGVRLVVFNGAKLGLALHRRGVSAVVVRNKTSAIDAHISHLIRIGDQIVFAAGRDLQSLGYDESMDIIATSKRPLVLGFACATDDSMWAL